MRNIRFVSRPESIHMVMAMVMASLFPFDHGNAATMLPHDPVRDKASPASTRNTTVTARPAKASKPATEASSGIEQVIVTSTRRATTLQNTPMAIDTISNATMQKMNARTISDFFSQIPGMSVQDSGPGQKRYVIRNITAPGEPEVGLYLDEIPLAGFTGQNTDSGSQQPDVKLWDMNRVEVLKGPQGTLYGAGSEGGTIRILSQRPDMNAYHGVLNGSVSTMATGGLNNSVNGTINIPLIKDKLALRINMYRDHDDGWLKEYYLQRDATNWTDNYGGRINLRATPTDKWTIDFIAYYQSSSTGDLSNISSDFASVSGTKWAASNFVQQPYTDNFQAYNIISNYEFPTMTLTGTASWQQRKMTFFQDSTVTHTFPCTDGDYVSCQPFSAVQERLTAGQFRSVRNLEAVRAWSSEVRLSSKNKKRLQWTIGSFYQIRDNTYSLNSGLADSEGFYDFIDDYAPTSKFRRSNADTSEQIAGFGEVTYEIIHGLKATGGVRVFRINRSLVSTGEPLSEYHQTSATGRFNLSYQINHDALIYAQAAEGYRMGGPNAPVGLTYTIPKPYASDTLWDYELGWKTGWLHNRLTVDGAFYYMDWSNIQQQGTDPTGAYDFITNAGSAVATGFETEVSYRPIHDILLGGGVNYTDAHLVGAQPTEALAINQIKAGDALPFVPRWTLNGNVEYDYQLGHFPGWLRGEVSYQSSRTTAFDPVSPAYARIGGWFLMNLSTGIKLGRYDAEIYCRNALNRVTRMSGSLNALTPLVINSAPPMTVGLMVNAKF